MGKSAFAVGLIGALFTASAAEGSCLGSFNASLVASPATFEAGQSTDLVLTVSSISLGCVSIDGSTVRTGINV
jgi:hypothetical protein